MREQSTEEDEGTWQRESQGEFEESSRCFYEGDKLRYMDLDEREAEKKYRQAMDATRDYGVFYHLAQGQIYSMRGNIENALTEFEIASELNDQIDSVFINLGLTYRKMAGRLRSFNLGVKANEMIKESVDALNRALGINPNNAGTWSALAITYLKMGKEFLKDAETCIERACEVDPNNYEAVSNLALIRQRQKNKVEARQFAEKAISIRPERAFAYGILGARSAKSERLEEKAGDAIVWLEKGITREPNNSYFLSEMGKAYVELEEYDKAVTWFDRALKADDLGDKKYGVQGNRGNAYRLAGRLERAEIDLRKSLEIRPDYEFAIGSLIHLLKEQQRYEEAFHLAENTLIKTKTPQNHRRQKELKLLYEQDKSKSIELTNHLVTTNANISSEVTLQQALEALRLYSLNHHAWGLLGRCLAERGEIEAARKHFQRALTLKPDDHFYRLRLGFVLEKQGEWKAAEREYNLYISSSNHDEEARSGLRRVREHLLNERGLKGRATIGPELVFLNNKTGREEHHPVALIRAFLYDRMKDWNLPIREIIEQIGNEPVFIIAQTGVGKTVTVPTKVLLDLCEDLLNEGAELSQKFPHVYVVEPRIPICTMTMAEMNEGYQNYVAYRMIDYSEFRDFLNKAGINNIESKDPNTIGKIVEMAHSFVKQGNAPYNPRHFNLYGSITSAGKINGDAPIQFITTGIMESLTFDGTQLDPRYDRIIIDEAHVTIEANPGIELGIALARKRGIKIDYMSATVDEATLARDLGVKIVYADAQRFPIHLTNLKANVEDCILDLVKNFLLEPDDSRFPDPNDFTDRELRSKVERVRLHLLSRDNFQDEGRSYSGLKNRPQGMLVIVNSHQNEDSDTHRIADLIARADFNRTSTRVHTLRLASPVVRDPSQKLAFDRLIKNIEENNGRYVIVATNVVEMGLTFSSLDYVVTMDSEFDNIFIDGGQMIRKVELGVNALYQRIGRTGRVRPGMAFIARDFGASYSELDDKTLAAGLRKAPVRYPLAKGSFLKLALYSFREKMPENVLLQQVASLNLPSRIHDNPELWACFLSERNRLRRIGIATKDSLSSAGEAALTLIGLDDMDFAYLLAKAVEVYGPQSDMAIIFTVLAAASEFGFEDLMAKRYFLANPKQLSSIEIFHEDALGIPALEAYYLVKHHEHDPARLFEALCSSGGDKQVSNDICILVRQGYRLVNRDSFNSGGEYAQDSFEAIASKTYLEELEQDNRAGNDNDTNRDLSEAVRGYLGHDSTKHTIAFEWAVVSFSDQSDLINIYRVYWHFFAKYFSRLKLGVLSALEESELRRSMDEEASKLQLSVRTLADLNKRFNQLATHVGIEFSRKENRIPYDQQPDEDDRAALRDSIIRDLLFEREGHDERFDLSLRFFNLVGGRRTLQSRDFERTAEQLSNLGFDTTKAELKELWFLIVKDAQRRYNQAIRLFEVSRMPVELPRFTKGLEKEFLRFVREIGYHRKLCFSRSDSGFRTRVADQAGTMIEIGFSDDTTPLSSALNERESITVFAKLTPRMISKDVRHEGSDSGFVKQEEKAFRLSHVTLLY